MNENLHRQLVDACERYVMIEKYGQAIDSIETENARLYDDYEKTKRKGFSAVSGVLLLIFGGIFLWFALVFAGALLSAVLESPIIMMLMYVVAIGLAFLIPVFPIMYKLTFCRSKNKKIDQENSKYFQEKYLPLMEKMMTILPISKKNAMLLSPDRNIF